MVSSGGHVYELLQEGHIACLSFEVLYKHLTLPRNCLACITHAGLYLPGHIMKLWRLSIISLSGAAGGGLPL